MLVKSEALTRESKKFTSKFTAKVFFRAVAVLGSLVVFLSISSKSARAAQTTLQVEIRPQVIVIVDKGIIQQIYSNLGKIPSNEKIIWSNGKEEITPHDSLIKEFTSISQSLVWDKAGVIYKKTTIFEKIASLFI